MAIGGFLKQQHWIHRKVRLWIACHQLIVFEKKRVCESVLKTWKSIYQNVCWVSLRKHICLLCLFVLSTDLRSTRSDCLDAPTKLGFLPSSTLSVPPVDRGATVWMYSLMFSWINKINLRLGFAIKQIDISFNLSNESNVKYKQKKFAEYEEYKKNRNVFSRVNFCPKIQYII